MTCPIVCACHAMGINQRPWFNIKMSSYPYRKSHCGDKTVVRSSYLHNGISYTGKMSSLYWIGAQVVLPWFLSFTRPLFAVPINEWIVLACTILGISATDWYSSSSCLYLNLKVIYVNKRGYWWNSNKNNPINKSLGSSIGLFSPSYNKSILHGPAYPHQIFNNNINQSRMFRGHSKLHALNISEDWYEIDDPENCVYAYRLAKVIRCIRPMYLIVYCTFTIPWLSGGNPLTDFSWSQSHAVAASIDYVILFYMYTVKPLKLKQCTIIYLTHHAIIK